MSTTSTMPAIDRNIAPPIIDAKAFSLQLPPCKKLTLKNGIDVFAIDLGEEDVLMVNWIFSAGNWFEQKNLVAAATNYLLKNGTKDKNAFQINEHFEYYGAYLNRSASHETADITLHCLTRHLPELLPAVAEMISESVFPQEELDIFKKNMQQRLRVNLLKNDFVAGRLIDAYLFGESHPYGKFSSEADFASLTREDLQRFFTYYYQAGECFIMVAGKLPENIIQLIDDNFGTLPLKKRDLGNQGITHQFAPAEQKKYSIINDPNGVQGAIRIARPFPNRHHPDFMRVQVLNNLFGGFFGSRLMTNIREDKGYTYGIHSYLLNLTAQSGLMISTEAGKEVCDATINEVYKEMEDLRNEPVDEEELQIVRSFMIGSILGDLDGPFQVANRWKNLILNGLDESYFYKSIDVVKTITPEELQALALQYFNPSDFYELVVI